MRSRWVVTASRLSAVEGGIGSELVVVGTFQSEAGARKRADVIERLASTYEDDSTLNVIVEPLMTGATSARDVLTALYDGPLAGEEGQR